MRAGLEWFRKKDNGSNAAIQGSFADAASFVSKLCQNRSPGMGYSKAGRSDAARLQRLQVMGKPGWDGTEACCKALRAMESTAVRM